LIGFELPTSKQQFDKTAGKPFWTHEVRGEAPSAREGASQSLRARHPPSLTLRRDGTSR